MLYKRGRTYHTDITVNSVRYRQSLKTTNWQEAVRREKDLIGDIKEGKAAGPIRRGSFANLALDEALESFSSSRLGRVAERTSQIDKERSKVLKRLLGKIQVRKITAQVIRTYQDNRTREGVSGRTVNLEVTLLRQVLKRAKLWHSISDDVVNLPENREVIGKVLTQEQKLLLFKTAASRPEWEVAYCAAVIAANTTCRKVELLSLRWSDVDLFDKVLFVRRSKTDAGIRTIPLTIEALAAFARVFRRSEAFGGGLPEHPVFPACENSEIDFARHQKTFRTAWRSLVKETIKQAGDAAAKEAADAGEDQERARLRAAQPFQKFRFHDLRHQSITEMAEAGVPDAAMQSIAGHLSKKMLDHYSHVRMAAKRSAVEVLGGGLIIPEVDTLSVKGKTN